MLKEWKYHNNYYDKYKIFTIPIDFVTGKTRREQAKSVDFDRNTEGHTDTEVKYYKYVLNNHY